MMIATLLAQANLQGPKTTGGGSGIVGELQSSIIGSLELLTGQFVEYIDNLLAAVVVFFLGWAFAVAVGRLLERFLAVLRINQFFERISSFKVVVERAGLHVNIPLFAGEILKWYLILVTLLAATNILRLGDVSLFLLRVLGFIPNVAIAAFILIIAVVLANFVHRTIEASISAAGFGSGGFIATIAKWAIIVFASLAALTQLNVAVTLIQTIVTALFAMIALAGGLAFGLGGKEIAARWLQKVEADLTGKKK